MDFQQQNAKPISDDQELAKVLAGITQDSNTNLNYEETPVAQNPTGQASSDISENMEIPTQMPIVGYSSPIVDPPTQVTPPVSAPVLPAPVNNDLESIKKDALIELRPLVDKLDIAAEEKFDIYLLLLRSTDDKSLIAPAHEAARNITDESKRAQALLDIIKEIDFLSTPV